MIILFNNTPLNDDKRVLRDYGIKDGDLVSLQQIPRSVAQSATNGNS